MLQDICPEGEWEQFVEVLKKPLPITFRINGSGRYANELRENLESDFFANFSKGPIVVSSSTQQCGTAVFAAHSSVALHSRHMGVDSPLYQGCSGSEPPQLSAAHLMQYRAASCRLTH
jgi:hypothetical protein